MQGSLLMATDTLKKTIQEDMKNAMRAKDKARLGTIRMLLAAIKQREIDEQKVLQDADILNVVNKMIKQRRDAAQQYQAANRQELAAKELKEITVLESYLPEQLSAEKINNAIEAAIQSVNATSMQDMGKVMAVLKEQLAGRADMATVSTLVKKRLV